MERNAIPRATLGRLPLYLEYLKKLQGGDGETVSSTAIARGLSLGEVQVRKDLASVSGEGKPKIGYIKSGLIKNIEDCLGCNRLTSAVLVGAGKLGCALLDYDGFEKYGVKIVAAFDCSERKLENRSIDKILPADRLKEFCQKNHIRLGIITVGEGSAQIVCDCMVESGITAIWNFAPCKLSVPKGVILKQENLALSLAYLNSQLYQ